MLLGVEYILYYCKEYCTCSLKICCHIPCALQFFSLLTTVVPASAADRQVLPPLPCELYQECNAGSLGYLSPLPGPYFSPTVQASTTRRRCECSNKEENPCCGPLVNTCVHLKKPEVLLPGIKTRVSVAYGEHEIKKVLMKLMEYEKLLYFHNFSLTL